jgi:hypothetical protein
MHPPWQTLDHVYELSKRPILFDRSSHRTNLSLDLMIQHASTEEDGLDVTVSRVDSTLHREGTCFSWRSVREPVKDQIPAMKRRTMSPPRRTSSTYDGRVPPTRVPPPSGSTPRASLDLDAYFSSNLSKQRTTPYRSSPTTSPTLRHHEAQRSTLPKL